MFITIYVLKQTGIQSLNDLGINTALPSVDPESAHMVCWLCYYYSCPNPQACICLQNSYLLQKIHAFRTKRTN